jgi:hypothetical protein
VSTRSSCCGRDGLELMHVITALERMLDRARQCETA